MNNTPVHASEISTRRDSRSSSNGPEKQRKFKLKFPKKKYIFYSIGIIIAVALAVIIGLLFFQSRLSNHISSDRYQAVFLSNGQVYFGKLNKLNGSYFKLKDVFYLQTTTKDSSDTVQNASNQADGVHLVKLGNEIHGPEDEMIIDKTQILFIENIKKDGKVTSAITQYYKDNK